jgi:hypothetical protein
MDDMIRTYSQKQVGPHLMDILAQPTCSNVLNHLVPCPNRSKKLAHVVVAELVAEEEVALVFQAAVAAGLDGPGSAVDSQKPKLAKE